MVDKLIADALISTQCIALIGASNRPERPSYGVMKYLLQQGYNVIPVNPKLAGQFLQGRQVYASLAEIPGSVDMVEVFRHADAALEIAQEAIAIKAKILWLQLGIINEQAAALARAAGMTTIMDRCPKIEIPRLGLSRIK